MTFRPLNVLISHECSGVSRRAWRALGHHAYSCDLLPATDGETVAHLQSDGVEAMRRGTPIHRAPWDLVITHHVCRYLANSGSLRLYLGGKKVNGWDMDRFAKMQYGAEGFRDQFMIDEYRGPLCAENPVMHKWARNIINLPEIKRQTVQPYHFGDDASKATQLWLRGLPALVLPAKNTWFPPRFVNGLPRWSNQTGSGQNKLGPSAHRAHVRAITYPGIAQAMAVQWSSYLLNLNKS